MVRALFKVFLAILALASVGQAAFAEKRVALVIGNGAYPYEFPVGMMHSDLLRVRVNGDLCDPDFFSHQLHHSRDVKHQMSLISGGAIMAGVNVTKLKALEVIVPPI